MAKKKSKIKAKPKAKVKPKAVGEKRTAILEAALELFATRGFHATAIPLVAAGAGVAAGTIYLYFDSKETMVNALFQQWKALFLRTLQAAVQPDVTTRVQFARLWQAMASFVETFPRAFQFLESHFHLPYLDKRSVALEEAVLDLARAFAKAGKAAGDLKPLADDLLIALVFGAFINLNRQQDLGRLEKGPALLSDAEACCWDLIANKLEIST